LGVAAAAAAENAAAATRSDTKKFEFFESEMKHPGANRGVFFGVVDWTNR
jgi:hypothetical protein